MKWKDTSGYNRGERGVVEPTAWTLEDCMMRVTVHRYKGCEGWFVSVRELAIETRALASKDAEAAKVEAVASIALHLSKLTKSLERASQPSPASQEKK